MNCNKFREGTCTFLHDNNPGNTGRNYGGGNFRQGGRDYNTGLGMGNTGGGGYNKNSNYGVSNVPPNYNQGGNMGGNMGGNYMGNRNQGGQVGYGGQGGQSGFGGPGVKHSNPPSTDPIFQ
jgi:hypothetical protein